MTDVVLDFLHSGYMVPEMNCIAYCSDSKGKETG